MGTAISHANLISVIDFSGTLNINKSLKSLIFLIERYCDDYMYQSIVRSEVNKEVLKENLSIFDMKTRVEKIDDFVEKSLDRMLSEFFSKKKIDYLDAKGSIEDIEVKANLPWNRTFEVKCEVKIKFKERRNEGIRK